MTVGILKSNTLVAIMPEVTEGTYVAPADGTAFLEVLEDGMELVDSKELVERNILTPSIGNVAPRTSTKSVSGTLPVEWKGAGVAGGGKPDYSLLLDSLLGGYTAMTTFTTDVEGTINTLISTAHGASVGDYLSLQIAGGFHNCFVKSVEDADNLTFTPAAPGVIASGIVVLDSSSFFPVNSGQPTISASIFWGDEILETAIGCRASSMSLESFTTGQIPNLSFAFEGLDFDRTDGSAGFAPIYAPGLPPIVLGATLASGGECIKVNDVTLSVENVISFLTTVCSLNGKVSSRYSDRTLSGTFNPYLDDTTTEWFDKFEADTLFELTITLGVPSGVAGETVPGSNVGIYLPSVLITETPIADLEGLLINSITFNANTGASGEHKEIYLGFS